MYAPQHHALAWDPRVHCGNSAANACKSAYRSPACAHNALMRPRLSSHDRRRVRSMSYISESSKKRAPEATAVCICKVSHRSRLVRGGRGVSAALVRMSLHYRSVNCAAPQGSYMTFTRKIDVSPYECIHSWLWCRALMAVVVSPYGWTRTCEPLWLYGDSCVHTCDDRVAQDMIEPRSTSMVMPCMICDRVHGASPAYVCSHVRA